MTKRANGEGSCYQLKNGEWRAVDVGRTVYRKGKTQREAMARRDQALKARGTSLQRTSSRSTVAEFLAAWLESKRASIRSTTAAGYAAVIATHIAPIIGPTRRLDQLEPVDLQLCLDTAARAGRSVATIRHIYRLAHQALEHARKQRMIPSNPCDSLLVPRKKKSIVVPLYDAALKGFMAAASADRLKALWLMAAGFGPRRGEALGLLLADTRVWSELRDDVLHWRAIVRTHQSLQRGPAGAGLIFLGPKSESGDRTIELPEIAAEALHEWLEHREAERIAAGARWQESGLLFCTRYGTALEPRHISRQAVALLAAAGIVSNLKALRHTAASMLLRDGVDIKTVQHILGHATAAMTLDTYGHLLPGGTATATSRMNESLIRLRDSPSPPPAPQ